MSKKFIVKRTFLSLLVGSMGYPYMVFGEQLPLVQYPAGSASRNPAPNVIISVDNSGSMGSTGIEALKTALKEAFKPENVPDESIRLAYQSMWSCNTIPSSHTSCGGNNYMQMLKGKADSTDASHRGRFLKWVDTLKAESTTPTHDMMRNAGEYLKLTGNNSPWNTTPGTADQDPITCRRAYHVLMTDGGWNAYKDLPMFGKDSMDATGEIYNQNLDNADGTQKTLPDGKTYDPTSGETRIYADPWGRQTVDAGDKFYWMGSNGNEYSSKDKCENATKNCKKYERTEFGWRDIVPTVADQAFYYWSTDLQPGILDKVNPIITKSGDEKFTVGSKSQTVSEYWNPKNNPATWQHMITYTIGYKNAATWPVISTDPVFGTNTFDGDFAKLIVGDKKWQNPIQPPLASGRIPTRDGYAWYTVPTGAERYPSSFTVGGSSIDIDVEEVRQQELWHIALNSRGKFVPAPEPEDLVKAFKDLVGSIVVDNKTPITSAVNSSSSKTRSDTAEYKGGYEAQGWKGYVKSDTVAKTTGAPSANAAWGTKTGIAYPNNHVTTADKLDALSETDITNRLVLTTNDSNNTGVSFEWSTGTALLSANQKTLLDAGSLGSARLNFIRGNRTLEGDVTGKPFRIRTSRQGDIVNSQVWYVAQPVSNYSYKGYTKFVKDFKNRLPMLYVGGNDGMLHGFSAENGTEKIAYIPKGIIKNLPELTKPTYQHMYFVDGSPFSGDVDRSSGTTPDWRTLLVGTLGAGGKGYFILDVTKPGSPTSTIEGAVDNSFSKGNASTLVVLDKTAHKDETFATNAVERDIGHIFAQPVVDDTSPHFTNQIARLNNGRWAVVMGNGYNSTNERPVLLIQYLSGSDTSLKIIPAAAVGSTNAVSNGLSAPRLVDINGDGAPDVAYAGDLRGNLWKFDISSGNADEWGVAFGGSPLHIAQYAGGGGSTSLQPIMAPPIVKANDRGARGLMVAYGTGRSLTEGDRTDTSKQTIYSILDKTQYKLKNGKVVVDSNVTASPVGTGTTALVQQTVQSTAIDGSGDSSGRKMWKVSQNAVDFNSKSGWYLDFPETGERLLQGLSFYDGSNILEVKSIIPGSGGSTGEESCAPSPKDARAFTTFLNIMDGKKPSVQIIDANGDGIYNTTSDSGVSRIEASLTESKTFTPKIEIRMGSDGKQNKFAKMPETVLRPSWRQLQ